MKKDDNTFIEHIWESINKIEEYTKGLKKEEFLKKTAIQDACMRRLEIIGEATKNLSEGWREEHKEVPWSAIAKTRDILIHSYFGVDLEETWNILKKDLPALKKQIQNILKKQP